MAIPGEDFVLRLQEASAGFSGVKVLDLLTAPDTDPVALCRWELGDATGLQRAGLALIRFDPAGNVRWQLVRALCGPGPADACGLWLFESGAVTRGVSGFLIIGTIVRAGTDVPRMIVIGVTEAGALMFVRTFSAVIGGRQVQGRAIGIAPLTAAEEFVVAARSAESIDSWFFHIDGNGIASGTAFIVPNTVVRRLRRLPTQRICAVGEKYVAERTPRPWILNLDPTTLSPVWERVYDTGSQQEETGVRWYDIAEGAASMLVVGNQVSGIDEFFPLFASLAKDTTPPPPDVGGTRWARQARFAGERLLLRGVVSFQSAAAAAFSFCGEFAGWPWHVAMIEDGAVTWQKAYRLPGAAVGTLAPMIWPALDQIVAGGAMTAAGIVVSSHFTIDGGAARCAQETHAEMPFVEMTSELSPSPMPPLAIRTAEWYDAEAPQLLVRRGCLDQD
jgi:hypothetical protein